MTRNGGRGQHRVAASFALRLRDLLSTLEAAAIIGAAEHRMRGLGEQLQFACMTFPCDEALVALELATLGRLRVACVASAERWRSSDLELLPSGTPFAYLLGGGHGYAVELDPGDELMQALSRAATLDTSPSHGLFVPIRLGGSVLGGAALLRATPLGDDALDKAERLAEVLSLTIESHRSERVLLSLFAAALPDLVADDAPTDFADALESYIHQLRVGADYRRRLALAEAIGRIAANGERETLLATEVLQGFERYVKALSSGDGAAAGEAELLTDDLYE